MLNRHIIVEGMDNTGKTTLLKALSKKFGVSPINSCRNIPKKDQIKWMEEQLVGTPKLFDRFALISEAVYGPFIRGTHLFPLMGEENFFNTLGKVVIPANPIIIICNPGVESVRKTFDEREQLEGAKERIEALLASYTLMGAILDRMTNLTTMVYNYNKHTPELIATILEYYMGGED